MSQISGRGKGGSARAKALSPRQRSAIAKKAAAARWGQTKPQNESLKATGEKLDAVTKRTRETHGKQGKSLGL